MSTTETDPIFIASSPETGVEFAAQRTYEELLYEAKSLGAELQVPYETYNTTFRLLEELKNHHEISARDSLQGLSLALKTVDAIGEFYGMDVLEHKRLVWSAFILHDIGRLQIRKELHEKSHKGEEWTDADREEMKQHVKFGYNIAVAAGLPEAVCNAIAESHNKQFGAKEYGVGIWLGYVDRIVRDCVAVTDFADAMLNRENTRNKHLSRHERLALILQDIEYVFGDYNGSQMLSQHIYNKLVTDSTSLQAA